jgi:uroporphyrinogen decarboxylase
MRLSSLARLSGRRICIPSAGYAAVALSGTTVSENLHDGTKMFRTLEAAVMGFGLEADGTVSDLTIEPEACGCPVVIPDNDTPYVCEHPFSPETDPAVLEVPDPSRQPRMRAMTEAVRLLSRRFALPTVAGGSGPFTLAAELVGASEAAIYTITEKEYLHRLLEYCTAVCMRYLRAICAAGADIVLIGEPTATILSADAYREFSGRYTARIIEALKRPVILHICGDAGHLLEAMCETGAQGLSLDAPVDLPAAAKRVPRDVVLVGNVNTVSVLLEGTPGLVRDETTRLLESMRPYPNFVLSSGCDLSYHTPPENIIAMIDAVRRFR